MNIGERAASLSGFGEAIAALCTDPTPSVPVLTAKVKLLWHCNLSCVFCRRPTAEAMMSRETAQSLGSELAALGLSKVHFSGGEVLLHPERHGIFRDWAGRGIQVNITSNGYLMDKTEVRRLEDAGVHTISLSIDSADRKIHDRLRGVRGSHKAVVRAAERIASRGKMKLRVNTVITARNIEGLDSLRAMVRGWGDMVSWKLIPVDPVVPGLLPSLQAIERLAREAAQWTEPDDSTPFGTVPEHFGEASRGRYGYRSGACFVPWFHLFFGPDGAAHPCCMSRGSTPPLGKFPEQTVGQILRGRVMNDLRAFMAAGGRLPACAQCDDFVEENALIGRLAGRSGRS